MVVRAHCKPGRHSRPRIAIHDAWDLSGMFIRCPASAVAEAVAVAVVPSPASGASGRGLGV